jgi:hypothetical protein
MAPFASDSQRRFFHSKGAKKAGITKADIEKWDAESKGKKVPEKVKKKKATPKKKKVTKNG